MSGVPASGEPPSLKCAGTGGTGWWYLGPTMQPANEKAAIANTARIHILIPILLVAGRCWHIVLHAARERIRRVGDDRVRLTDSAHQFDGVAEIMAKHDL